MKLTTNKAPGSGPPTLPEQGFWGSTVGSLIIIRIIYWES